jgi:hypothetical protein
MSQDMAQLGRNMAVIAGERKRRSAKWKWTAGFLVFRMLPGAAWPWIKAVLHH